MFILSGKCKNFFYHYRSFVMSMSKLWVKRESEVWGYISISFLYTRNKCLFYFESGGIFGVGMGIHICKVPVLLKVLPPPFNPRLSRLGSILIFI